MPISGQKTEIPDCNKVYHKFTIWCDCASMGIELPFEDERILALGDLNLPDQPCDQAFDDLIRLVAELTGASMSMLYLIDADRQYFFTKNGTDLTETTRETTFCIQCLASGSPLLVRDALEDVQIADSLPISGEPHFRSYLGVPMHEPDGLMIGTLCVFSSSPDVFDQTQIALLTSIAQVAQRLIDLRRYNLEIERVKSLLDEEIRKVERNRTAWAIAGRMAGIGVWKVRLDTYELFWSESIYAIHGRSEGHGITVDQALDYYVPEDRERVRQALKSISEHGVSLELEACIRREDGSIRRVRSSGERVVRDGKPDCLVGVVRDVTEESRNHEAMARMGRILDDSSNEIYVFDAETLKFSWINRGARENLGYDENEIIKLTPVDIKPEYDEARFRASVEPLVTGSKNLHTFETTHRRKDGSEYPVAVNLSYAEKESPPVFVAMIKDITKEIENAEIIERLAFHDQLTGLANRPLLLDRLKQAISKASREGTKIHLLFMDLNRFKEINDTRGHAVGDEVLVQVSERLRALLRENETLARLGGDEFVAILEGSETDDAANVIQRLIQAVEAPITVEGKSHALSVSIGAATYPTDSTTSQGLLQLADIAMYAAKGEGGGCRFYDEEMGKLIARELELSDRFRTAIISNSLELHYQPIIDFRSGAIAGAEALVRWFDPNLGWLAPSDFIPVAEKRRMMTLLGSWVIDRTCAQIASWQARGLDMPERIAINIAAEQLECDNLVSVIRESCQRNGVSPKLLEVEITESGMMADPGKATECLKALKSLGVEISIDDFGTGYSSLSYLRQFEVDKLKIDMAFVQDILNDPNCLAIVSATIGMAHGLGLKVVAEGVETTEQASKLKEMGCDLAQGFLYGQALAPDAFAKEWLQAQTSKPNRLKTA